MPRTLGEAIDETLKALEKKDPKVAEQFSDEYNSEKLERVSYILETPNMSRGNIFGELLARMQAVLDKLSQPKVQTLGEAIDETLKALEKKDPKVAEQFSDEYNSEKLERVSYILETPNMSRGNIFGELLARMREALEA